jgi:hypothetical protein
VLHLVCEFRGMTNMAVTILNIAIDSTAVSLPKG